MRQAVISTEVAIIESKYSKFMFITRNVFQIYKNFLKQRLFFNNETPGIP